VPIPDHPRLLAALVLLLTAAFIVSGQVRSPYRLWFRRAVIIGYLLAIGFVLVWTAKWLVNS
jgi:hypothetical protein